MESTVSSLRSYVEQVIAEFYDGLPLTKFEAYSEEVAVKVRDHLYKFSSAVINKLLGIKPLTEEEQNEDTTLDAISPTELVDFLTDGT